MAVRNFQTSSISTGSKRSKFWDQSTVISTNSYESIGTVTVGSSGQSTIEFTSIPSTYTHLQLRGIVRNANTSAGNLDMYMRFNGDSGSTKYTAYMQFNGYGTSSKGAATSFNTSSIAVAYQLRDGNSANYFTPFIIDIFDYKNTNKFKSSKCFHGSNPASTEGHLTLRGGLWKDTSAINQITITSELGVNFVQYSQFALYGIKGA